MKDGAVRGAGERGLVRRRLIFGAQFGHALLAAEERMRGLASDQRHGQAEQDGGLAHHQSCWFAVWSISSVALMTFEFTS